MIHWNDLKNLHVVKQTRNVIYKWWKVDVLIIDEKSITDHPLDFKETFQNPLIQEMFQQESARESFFKKLQFIHSQNHQKVSGFFEKWPNTGLNLFITPIRGYSHITGFIIATGSYLQKKIRNWKQQNNNGRTWESHINGTWKIKIMFLSYQRRIKTIL